MILADTSLWIAHFRQSHAAFAEQLSEGRIVTHPFVIGELACGNLSNRTVVLRTLALMPSAKLATNAEVLRLIEDRRLSGRGLGLIDVHLLASALLSDCRLWSLDKQLSQTAVEFGIA